MRNNTQYVPVILVIVSAPFFVSCTNAVTGTSTDFTPSEITHAGIIIEPSVESPWPDLLVYRYPNVIENVSPGDEFCIGLDVNPRLGMEWSCTIEGQGLELEETEFLPEDPENPGTGTDWYRFMVSGPGNAFVTFELITVADIVTTRLMFAFYSSE